jgi:hypothetical protein
MAVLGPPDNQELSKASEAYDAFMEEIPPLSMVETGETGKAWFLCLGNAWVSGRFERRNWGPMWVFELEQPLLGGMSGSPIVNEKEQQSPVPQTVLYRNLPGWMLV